MAGDKRVGGSYQPPEDYDCTGGIRRGLSLIGTTLSGTTAIGAGATLTNPTITGSLGTNTVLTPTNAVVLTAAQSGTSVFLNAAAGFAITVPAPAAGLNYRFTTAAVFATTNFTIVTTGGANLFEGGAMVAGAEVSCAAQDSINFVATAETIGDFVDLWSDGTTWFVNGRGKAAGSITFTVT